MPKRRIPILAKVVGVVIGIYILIRFVIQPPLPFSLVFMYMSLTVVGVLVYVSIYDDVWNEFTLPIEEFFRGRSDRGAVWQGVRLIVLAMIPLFIGWGVYNKVKPSYNPPAEQRVVHPAPPFEVAGLNNPLRQRPEKYQDYIKLGSKIYFQNCFYCHGDRFDGEGHFAHGFNLPPANFMDAGTIAQLQESFVFWRVSTGGPGLPAESTPWNSAMPKWEDMLNTEERWAVVMYLYEQTGWKPRTWQ
ncbi:MAG: c-type cytochrome [Nitrospirae bacterium]|nr:c-type cytochrome [Nitrospirota bacterium]